MPKRVEEELAEADRMHALAVRMRSQRDISSADALDRKVAAKRKKAIARMGKAVKRGNGGGKRVIV